MKNDIPKAEGAVLRRAKASCSPPLSASAPARRQAAVILEVLAGVRRPTEAAQVLSVSLPRYYQLERRALLALVAACEAAPRGPRLDPARRIAALERENQRWQRTCDRQQALVRAAERALGLALPPPTSPRSAKPKDASPGNKTPRRPRRASVRALRAARLLCAPKAFAEVDSATATGAAGVNGGVSGGNGSCDRQAVGVDRNRKNEGGGS
jgi:hypothetical protein